MNEKQTPSFSNAMEELESILERIEGEQVDVDELATQLRRAAELLDLCRSKIRRAETEVTQIVQRLDDEQAGNDDESAGGGEAPEGEPGSRSEPEDDDIPF